MTIEQPSNLNRLVDDTIPLTWQVRWRSFRNVVPLLLFCSINGVEMMLLRLWLRHRPIVAEWPMLLLMAVFPFVLLFLAMELLLRLNHRTKRRLRFEPKWITITPTKQNRVRWERISAWRLEPVSGETDLARLTIEYRLNKKARYLRHWAMVLSQPDQVHALRAELERWRQVGKNTAALTELPKAMLVKQRARVRGMWLFALALYCLVHGFPLLGVGLSSSSSREERPAEESRLTPAEREKLGRLFVRYFKTPERYRRFLVLTGGGLTGMGVALYFWAFARMRKSAVTSEAGASENKQPIPFT